MRRISPRTLRIMKSPRPTSSRLPSVEFSVMVCSTALEAASTRMPCWITARGSRAGLGARHESGGYFDLAERVAGRFEIEDAGGAVQLLLDQPGDAVIEVF